MSTGKELPTFRKYGCLRFPGLLYSESEALKSQKKSVTMYQLNEFSKWSLFLCHFTNSSTIYEV